MQDRRSEGGQQTLRQPTPYFEQQRVSMREEPKNHRLQTQTAVQDISYLDKKSEKAYDDTSAVKKPS